MIKNSFLKTILFTLATVLLVSCDDDFNVLGTDIVGDDNFGFGTPQSYDVAAYNANLGALESTNLAINPLGMYDNPVYGTTKANFVTQVTLPNDVVNLSINQALEPVIDSVVLRIPYFSTQLTSGYELDSIYGNAASKMKLSVYENGYYIRSINPTDQLTQAYYTDQNSIFSNAVSSPVLNDSSDKKENDEFIFDNSEVKYANLNYKNLTDTVAVFHAPQMVLHLNKAYFQNKILNAPEGKLANNNVFTDWFRGLYFQVDQAGSEKGSLAMMNFKGGTLNVYYKQYVSVPNPDLSQPRPKKERKAINLTLAGTSGNTVSLIEQGSLNVSADNTKLFLKGGGNASMAVINIKDTDIQQIKNNNWLVNDASLTFTVDQNTMAINTDGAKATEPLRVYLYDLKNKRQIVDYALDLTTNSTLTKFNKYVFGGILKKEAAAGSAFYGRGISYKIRLTNHFRNLIKSDSTNVSLGLIVTETINDVATYGNKRLKSPVSFTNVNGRTDLIKAVPTMSVVHPLGTVLYGNTLPGDPNYDKRPKFEIYYTQQLKQD